MEPIRVLQIVEMINENSGVSSVVMNYYKHIDKNRFVFDFMTHTPVSKEIRSQLEKEGSKVYEMPALTGRNIPIYQKKLDAFFKEHTEYQIIHGHLPNAAAFYMRAAKKYGNQIRILHSHNSRGADSKLKRVRNYFLNHMGVAASNVYFACSKSAGAYLFHTTDENKVTIIHNAIDIEKFSYKEDIRERLRKRCQVEDKLVIGHMGRFAEQKNHRFIVQIAKSLKEKREDFVFLLVGDGKLRPEIEQMVQIEGLTEHFIFTGSVENPQDYYQMMDVFILPSIYEGLPVVGVEAQAAGLPCMFADTITREALLTPQVKQLSIQNADAWSEELSKVMLGRYPDYVNLVKQNGFDIKTEAGRLEDIYLKWKR